MHSLGKFLVTWRYSSLLLKSLWQPQGHCPHVKDISKLKHLMRDCAFVYASFDKGTHRCRVDTNPLYEVPPSSTLSQKCLDHISENFLLPTYLLSGVNIQARILLAPIFFLFGRHIKFQKRPVKVVVRVIICLVLAHYQDATWDGRALQSTLNSTRIAKTVQCHSLTVMFISSM